MTIAARSRGPVGRVRDAFRAGGQRQERLSVTVPPDLAEYVREAAALAQEGQSAIVSDAIRLHRREIRRIQTMQAIEMNEDLDIEMADEGMRNSPPIG